MMVSKVLKKYREDVSASHKYMSDAFIKDTAGTYVLSESHRLFIVDAAFLKFYKAWENYLESIFKCFILGEQTLHGGLIKTFVNAKDEEHATKLLVGINKYFDWSNHEYVIKISKIYLEENNIIESEIKKITQVLTDLKTLRNAAAHMTDTTKKPLDALYQRISGKQINEVKITDIIFAEEPVSKLPYWEYFIKILDVVAENIANG